MPLLATPLLMVRILKHIEGDISFAAGQIFDSSGELIRELKIPIGYVARPLEVDLPAGNYLIRAALPSGQALSQHFRLDDLLRLDLEAQGSEHERLSWHHFASGEAKRGRAPIELASFPGSTEGLRYEAENRIGAFPTVSAFLVGSGGTSEPVVLNVWGDRTLTHRGTNFEVNTYLDDPYLLVRIRTAGPTGDPGSWPRVFIKARLGDDLQQITAVPVPWPDLGRTQSTKLSDVYYANYDPFHTAYGEVLICRPSAVSGIASGYSPPKVIASTVIRDPVFGAALAFLASGDPTSAEKISAELRAEASQLLYDKLENPFAAAAGGYLLLATYREWADSRGSAPAFKWTENLMNWFPWLPDGAILHGWMRIRRGTEVDLAVALESFLMAAKRGIPFFTGGLRLLVQGLSYVRGEKNNSGRVEEAIAKVRPYAAAADPSQLFATFYGSNPESPMVPPSNNFSGRGGGSQKYASRTRDVREVAASTAAAKPGVSPRELIRRR